MRPRLPVTSLALVLAVAACSKAANNQVQDQNIALDDGMPGGNAAIGNADIETLPADESSATPSSQLANGTDAADVNDAGNATSR